MFSLFFFSILQQYHGAARLAFGQNPEIVSSTSTSTTTATAITTSTRQKSLVDISSSGVEHENTSPIEITNNGERRSGNMNGAKVPYFHLKFVLLHLICSIL